MICEICGISYEGLGHNAFPLTVGECCETCNEKAVIPYRLYKLGLNEREGLIIRPDNSISIIKPQSNRFSLKELQDYVEGYIEYYPTGNKKYDIIVNEEGLIMRLPFNTLTSKLFGIHTVGNVLIIPKRVSLT